MAIKILNTDNKGGGSGGGSDDIVGELVTGYGQVPDYVSYDGYAIRSDDPDVAQAVADYFNSEVEEHEGKRPYYALIPEETVTILASYIKTEMVLRSSKTFKPVRQCDGEEMKDGTECQCAMVYEMNSPEWRQATKDGLACSPEGRIFFTIDGVDVEGKFVFSKSSLTTVPPFVALDEKAEDLTKPVQVEVGLRSITSKAGHSWVVPTFGDPEEV